MIVNKQYFVMVLIGAIIFFSALIVLSKEDVDTQSFKECDKLCDLFFDNTNLTDISVLIYHDNLYDCECSKINLSRGFSIQKLNLTLKND